MVSDEKMFLFSKTVLKHILSPGLSAAIRLMQNAQREGNEIRVCVIEKAPELGLL